MSLVVKVILGWMALSVLLALAWSALLGALAKTERTARTVPPSSDRPAVTVHPVRTVRTVRPSWDHQGLTEPWDPQARRER